MLQLTPIHVQTKYSDDSRQSLIINNLSVELLIAQRVHDYHSSRELRVGHIFVYHAFKRHIHIQPVLYRKEIFDKVKDETKIYKVS